MIKQGLYIQSVSAINSLCSLEDEMDTVQIPLREPDYKLAIPFPMKRRRMSRIIKLGVASALHVMKDMDCDAIITASGLGCMADTQKFYDSVIDSDEQLPNPTSFIQSTFNTIGGQIALLKGNHSYNMTHTHRGFSFENAIIDSVMKLNNKNVNNVLLGGIDEITNTQETISRRLGIYKNHRAGEAANFFILTNEKKEDSVRIKDIKTLYKASNIEEDMQKFLLENNMEISDIDIFLSGETQSKCSFKNLLANVDKRYFKDYCGEFHTASSFAMWLGTQLLRGNYTQQMNIESNKKLKTVLIFNNYQDINYSFLLLQSV